VEGSVGTLLPDPGLALDLAKLGGQKMRVVKKVVI
jgi:hypothetical protein